ncbi:MAG: PilZ domain-containing protein [Desulfobacteraceae bacterium]|nr:PilZ domain-containing protein [Desulfobacteraceae bacterium]
MKKRQCQRFNVRGTTLHYKEKPLLWGKGEFSRDYYPVLDISRGGLKFLSNHKIPAGSRLTLRINFPGLDHSKEIKAVVRWISRNREASYRYQNGVSFNAYGSGRQENHVETLNFLKLLESKYLM